jgi:hypothetical protein
MALYSLLWRGRINSDIPHIMVNYPIESIEWWPNSIIIKQPEKVGNVAEAVYHMV